MKTSWILSAVVVCGVALSVTSDAAQTSKSAKAAAAAKAKATAAAAKSAAKNKKKPVAAATPAPAQDDADQADRSILHSAAVDANISRAKKLAAAGQYQEASKLLFQMSRSRAYASESGQIKYILGLMLYQMKLNQSAAFIFYDLIRQESHTNKKSKYLRLGLTRLAIAADSLDSDVLLRYAIKQVDEGVFPAANRDMLYYRTGEIKLQEKQYVEAARQFVKVRSSSIFFLRARYRLALALAEAGDLAKAQQAFEDLMDRTKNLEITDRVRVGALLGRARVLYQRQQFAAATEAYRQVPRDTEQWHEALFESTWAMLRDGQFRSALSNFHSLHSSFYDEFYQPESLLLRAITYLYICRYDEMEKVLDLYTRIYRPVARELHMMLDAGDDPLNYYRELVKSKANDVPGSKKRDSKIPFLVAREVSHEGDVRRTFDYLSNLETERRRLDAMPAAWKNASVGVFARKIIEKRIEATRVLAGKQIRRHMLLMQNELADLFEQDGFLRYEMLAGKKETLRKEIASKGLEHTQVDDDEARSYYIQNGYEYWPFKGEYWLDEIGNYHYVGVKACE